MYECPSFRAEREEMRKCTREHTQQWMGSVWELFVVRRRNQAHSVDNGSTSFSTGRGISPSPHSRGVTHESRHVRHGRPDRARPSRCVTRADTGDSGSPARSSQHATSGGGAHRPCLQPAGRTPPGPSRVSTPRPPRWPGKRIATGEGFIPRPDEWLGNVPLAADRAVRRSESRELTTA